MSISEPQNRYSMITEKNPREIVMLRGSGCKWLRCTFCDYHLDFSKDEAANYKINQAELSKITGQYSRLEVINSGSFCDLDSQTMELIQETCVEKNIHNLHFECHWMHRKEINAVHNYYMNKDIRLHIKMGVETFDETFRETVMVKGMPGATPKKIAEYAQEVCLLFGLTGQTLASMKNDIDTGLSYFERICINIMMPNSAKLKPDPEVISLFCQELYPLYKDNERVDILLENTDFGVGDSYE